MFQESTAFAVKGSDSAAVTIAGALPVGAPHRSASTPAAAATANATAGEASWRQGLATPASGGFDRRGAARYSLSRALQAAAPCSPAEAEAAAWRLEAALQGKCPAINSEYEHRYFKLASELRADASMCNSVLTGDDLSAEIAVVLLDVHQSCAHAAALPGAPPASAAPAAPGSSHHPASSLAAPPEPDGAEGREATPTGLGGGASRDLRCLTEQLAALHAASGVELALENPTLLHLRRNPENLIAVLAPTWRSELEALRALVPACRTRSKAVRAQEAQQRTALPPVLLEALAAPLPAWRPPASPKSPPPPPPPAADGAAEQQEYVRYTKESSKAAGLELAPRSLFVSLLPMDVRPAELAAVFAKFGAVDFAICPPPPCKVANGLAPTWRHGSVTMADESGKRKALLGRTPQQKMVLRPGLPLMYVGKSKSALVPMGHKRGEWVAPDWVAPPMPHLDDKDRSRIVEVKRQHSPAGRGSRVRSRSREPRHHLSPQRRSGCRSRSPRRRRRSRSRSRSPGRHGRRHSNSDSPMHATTPAARAKSHTAPKQPLTAQTLPPPPPYPPPNPPSAADAALIHTILTCSFFARPGHATCHPIAVVGTPLAGACALPVPLSLELQWPVSQVEQLGVRLSRERLSVIALAGADANAAEALRQLATQLAAPAMVPGGQMQAAGMLGTDGAAHFFLPLLCESALSLIRATAQPGAPPLPLHAAGVVVSLPLLHISDAAVGANRQAERHTSHAAPYA